MTETATRTYAFFDVDDTVVRLKTMFSFQDYYYRHVGFLPAVLGRVLARRFEAVRQRYLATGQPREALNRMYYRTFRGRRPKAAVRLLVRYEPGRQVF